MYADYFVTENALDKRSYDELVATTAVTPMRYGAKSNSETDPYGHLSFKPYYDRRANLSDIGWNVAALGGPIAGAWRTIREIVARSARNLMPETKDLKLIRCYVNAYTYGMDGYFHTDSSRADEITAILYLCDAWIPDWAGETVIQIGAGIQSILPAPNRLLVIRSNVMHCARAVSRMCDRMRMVLVFKMRPARDEGFEKLSTFLSQRGARDIEHKDGALHDHLVRVYSLLEQRKLPPEVCFGGGLHSIYGTNAFERQLLQPNAVERSIVAGMFGVPAEALAYLFSTLDRPACLEAPVLPNGSKLFQLKMRYDQSLDVSPVMLGKLQMIECANLVDQRSLQKWKHLKDCWDDWRMGDPNAGT